MTSATSDNNSLVIDVEGTIYPVMVPKIFMT